MKAVLRRSVNRDKDDGEQSRGHIINAAGITLNTAKQTVVAEAGRWNFPPRNSGFSKCS